jgi:hypothetical protein
MKNEFFFGKKNLFVLSMWKLTLGYGIGGAWSLKLFIANQHQPVHSHTLTIQDYQSAQASYKIDLR